MFTQLRWVCPKRLQRHRHRWMLSATMLRGIVSWMSRCKRSNDTAPSNQLLATRHRGGLNGLPGKAFHNISVCTTRRKIRVSTSSCAFGVYHCHWVCDTYTNFSSTCHCRHRHLHPPPPTPRANRLPDLLTPASWTWTLLKPPKSTSWKYPFLYKS